MEPEFLKATLIIIWQGTDKKIDLPSAEDLFPRGGSVGASPDGIVFTDAASDGEEADLCLFAPGRLTIASSKKDRIAPIYERARAYLKDVDFIAVGYNVEFEWGPVSQHALDWIRSRFIKSPYDTELTTRCVGVSFMHQGADESMVAIRIEPRFNDPNTVFVHINKHLEGSEIEPILLAETFESFIQLGAPAVSKHFLDTPQ